MLPTPYSVRSEIIQLGGDIRTPSSSCLTVALIRFANMPSGEQNNITSFIITDKAPAPPAVPFFLPAYYYLRFPTNLGNAYSGAPSSTISGLEAILIPHPMVLSSHLGTHFPTIQLHDNNLRQKLLGLTTHALLKCNMLGHNWRASNATPSYLKC